ncbi:MAG: zf-HC2 domain-containing protein [Desulfurivibrionaceae bacterium]
MNKPFEHRRCCPENLPLFFYGELDATEHLRMERHLEDCPACRKELAQLGRIFEILPKRELKISPRELAAFNERVNRRIRPSQNRFFRPVMGWSLATAATAALLLFSILPPTPEQNQSYPAMPLQMVSELSRQPETEMLLNLELLENLDLLQELEAIEAIG